MLLAIDIGNSKVAVGLFKASLLHHHSQIPTGLQTGEEAYGRLLSAQLSAARTPADEITGAIISCVVPPLAATFKSIVARAVAQDPLFVSAEMETGLTIRYSNPAELGSDRIASAVAAFHQYRTDVIVVDLGTATTFSLVTREGEFLGGAIAPGLGIAADALYSKTAQLPRVPLQRPSSVIGRDTSSNIQAGLLLGHAGLVDSMIERMETELGRKTIAVATGGLGDLVAAESRRIQKVHPFLTLEGLELLYRRSRLSSK